MAYSSIVVRKRVLVGVFVLILGAALVTLALFIIPSARVMVTPRLTEKKAEQTIILSAAAKEPDFKKFILPARVVEATGEAQRTIKRTGADPRPAHAKGTIKLINNQDEEQPLLPQTNVRHEATGTFFLTDTATRIPPHGEVMVSVTAKEEGLRGNVPPGKFIVDKLPTSLQAMIWGESTAAMAGGEIFDTPLSETELVAAQASAVEEATEKARGELTANAGGARIRDDLLSQSIEDSSASVGPGSLAASYTTSARVKLRTFLVDDTAVLSLTLLALQELVKPNEEFVSYEPGSFAVTFERADFDRGEARVKGQLTGSFAEKTESTIFDVRALAGRTPAEVQEYFEQFPSVDHVEVALSPFWVTTVPSREQAVEVVVEKKK